jgi:16S rRNA (guanine(1405)-N(7))-methyltransferase
MTSDIVDRVRRSARYRSVDPALLARLADEELPRSRNADDAVKRVKRRLHQAVGAFRPGTHATRSWPVGDPSALRAACTEAMRRHASTRERLPHLDRFYRGIWEHTGVPGRLLDLGCGLGPLGIPWMEIGDAHVTAVDVDAGLLDVVAGFLGAIGQPHRVGAVDLVAAPPPPDVTDVALLLKLVTTLDRQDPDAAARLLDGLRAEHAVVSFATRSLGGRGDARERSYRDRAERLARECGRVRSVAEASIPGELAFVMTLEPPHG